MQKNRLLLEGDTRVKPLLRALKNIFPGKSDEEIKEYANQLRHDFSLSQNSDLDYLKFFTNVAASKKFNFSDEEKNFMIKVIGYIKEYPETFVGLEDKCKDFNTLVAIFSPILEKYASEESERIAGMQLSRNPDYNIYEDVDYYTAKKIGKLSGKGNGGGLCYTQSKETWNNYTIGGKNKVYVALKKGYASIQPIMGENYPKDEYGLSMIFLFVSPKGELAYSNVRWNHGNGDYANVDHMFNMEELSKLLGVRFNGYSEEELESKGFLSVQKVQLMLDSGRNPKELFGWMTKIAPNLYGVKVRGENIYNIFKDNRLLSNEWYELVGKFHNGFARVQRNGKYGYINTEGVEIGDGCIYDGACAFENGFAIVVMNEKWGFINTEGVEIGEGCVYDIAYDFHDGFAAVQRDGKYGFINTEGVEIGKGCVYNNVYNFHDGIARVKRGGKYGFINTKGIEIGKGIIYDGAGDFYDGFAVVKIKFGCYYIDAKGNYYDINTREPIPNPLHNTSLNKERKFITITEKQNKFLNESLDIENGITKIPSHLLNDKNNPINDNPSISSNLMYKIISKRFIDIKSEFSDDITKYDNIVILNKLNKLIIKCLKKEDKIRPQLENICLNILIENFNIPEEGVEIDCELASEISNTTQFHITPDTDEDFEYEDYNSIEQEDMDTKKRELTSAIIVGGSMQLSENMFKKYISKIFELDEELPHLYSEIMKINNYLLFSKNFEITDKSHKQGGFVNVKIGNDMVPTKIEAKGIIFPILLIECIRGCMELWASHGLPDDVNKARAVINRADALIHDPWYTRIGPILWDKIYNGFDLKYLPTFISKLSELPNEKFFNLLKECFAGTKLGKEKMKELIEQSKYNDDYSSFEHDIKKKQSERTIIEDEYFTEEELNEAIYPEEFNMDYFKGLKTFSERIRYCEAYLQRISSGSARIAYKIDDNTVLKLAKNSKGVAQNEVEGQRDYYRDNIGCFAEVYDVDKNYLWLEMQLARKAKPSDFKRLTGYDFQTVCYWIDYCKPDRYCPNPMKRLFTSEEFHDNWDEYGLLSQLEEYIGNYDVPIGDLKRISSWGVVNNEYGEQLVIVDFGLDNYVLNKFYRR